MRGLGADNAIGVVAAGGRCIAWLVSVVVVAVWFTVVVVPVLTLVSSWAGKQG